jgi:hypothetical protein
MTAMRSLNAQRGVALVVGMVMLVILTLVVLSAVTMSTSNVKATANMQFRDAALAAANLAIEQVVSSPINATAPPTPVQIDLDHDGTSEYVVTVPVPACTYWRVMLNRELNISDPNDLPCFAGSAGVGGMGGRATSLCAETRWAVRAPVNDQATGAVVSVNQGIGVRMSRAVAERDCN